MVLWDNWRTLSAFGTPPECERAVQRTTRAAASSPAGCCSHDVDADSEFDEKVDAFARHMADQPPEAFAAGKLAIDLCANLGPAQSRNVELLANGQLFTGDEHPQVLEEAMRRRGKTSRAASGVTSVVAS